MDLFKLGMGGQVVDNEYIPPNGEIVTNESQTISSVYYNRHKG